MKKLMVILTLIAITGCGSKKNIVADSSANVTNLAAYATPAVVNATQIANGMNTMELSVGNKQMRVDVNSLPNALTKLRLRFIPGGGTSKGALAGYVIYNSPAKMGLSISVNGSVVQNTGLTAIDSNSAILDFTSAARNANSLTINISKVTSDVYCLAKDRLLTTCPLKYDPFTGTNKPDCGEYLKQYQYVWDNCAANSIGSDDWNGTIELETNDTVALK